MTLICLKLINLNLILIVIGWRQLYIVLRLFIKLLNLILEINLMKIIIILQIVIIILGIILLIRNPKDRIEIPKEDDHSDIYISELHSDNISNSNDEYYTSYCKHCINRYEFKEICEGCYKRKDKSGFTPKKDSPKRGAIESTRYTIINFSNTDKITKGVNEGVNEADIHTDEIHLVYDDEHIPSSEYYNRYCRVCINLDISEEDEPCYTCWCKRDHRGLTLKDDTNG